MFTSRLVLRASPLAAVAAAGARKHTWASPGDYESASVKDQCVLITGATAGIGKALAWRFAAGGAKIIITGRRQNRLLEIKSEIEQAYPGSAVHTVAIDIQDIAKVTALPDELPAEFQNVDILINNAGLARGMLPVDKNDMEGVSEVIQTNVVGLIAMTTAFVPGMKARGSGHLINIGSVAGHYAYPKGTVYNASKYAVTGYTAAARHDLVGTPIRVTQISPGQVHTEFSIVRLGNKDKAEKVYENITPLSAEDVADNVYYTATRPAHVQIADMIIYPTNQSSPTSIARVGASLGKATPQA